MSSCGCQKISGTMKKSVSKRAAAAAAKPVNMTWGHLGAYAGGVIAGLGVNYGVNKITEGKDWADKAKKAVPYAKVAGGLGGAYYADNAYVQFGLLGVASVGVVEVLVTNDMTSEYFDIEHVGSLDNFNQISGELDNFDLLTEGNVGAAMEEAEIGDDANAYIGAMGDSDYMM